MTNQTYEQIFEQSLASAALNQSVTYNGQVKLRAVYIRASTTITETITITLVSPNGSTYDIVVDTKTLNAEQNYIFHPTWELIILKGASLKIQCTNANTTGTLYVTVHAEGGVI